MNEIKWSPFNVHDHYKVLTFEELKEIQKERTLPFSVCCYNTVRDFNLASVIRNACIFGASNVFILGDRRWDRRGAVGAYNYLNIENLKSFDELLDRQDVQHLVALEYPGHIPAFERSKVTVGLVNRYPWVDNTCILVGQEGCGIPNKDIIKCHGIAYVQQYGVMRSLNAATASGIAMHHCADTLYNNKILSQSNPYL